MTARRHKIFLSIAFDECWTIHSWTKLFQLSLAISFLCVSRFSLEFTIQAISKSFYNKKVSFRELQQWSFLEKKSFCSFSELLSSRSLMMIVPANRLQLHFISCSGFVTMLFLFLRCNHRQHAIHQFVLVTVSIVQFVSAFEVRWL